MTAAQTVADPRRVHAGHRNTIKPFFPLADDMEMAVRCELAMIRDQASFGWPRACPWAAEMLRVIDQQASEAVYAPFETSRLLRIRWALELGMMAARTIEKAMRVAS